MKEKLEHILSWLKEQLLSTKTSADCAALRVKVLGKSGAITDLLKLLKDIPSDEKPAVGALINSAKTEAEKLISDKETAFLQSELNQKLLTEKIDVTLKKLSRARGTLHPTSLGLIKICNILSGLGFKQIDGPEIDFDKYNFELVNIPKNHPARDMQDTFYITKNILLRTQTSNSQPRAMQKITPPFKVFCHGRVFRKDEYDATHVPSFYQVEGIYVDEIGKVTMQTLKETLSVIVKELMGESIGLKFRSSYFPFTEPSIEGDIICSLCMGKGCPSCKNQGGFELFGAGLIHPKVLEMNGIDSKTYCGYAFGFGFDRVVKNQYKIPHLRLMYENDVRFLRNFK